MKNRNVIFTTTLLALGFLALAPLAQAVTPAPDGGYPGGNTAEGQQALLSLTTGTYNTAVGFFSLRSNTEGVSNTAIGTATLLANTSAVDNTAIGAGALLSHTSGNNNTALGAFALFKDNIGQLNTAVGAGALFNNTTGGINTAIGYDALFGNTTGDGNTATGDQALQANSAGHDNTATGWTALGGNTMGNSNTADGSFSLGNNATGNNNTAIGHSALLSSSGNSNTALGFQTGSAVTTASNVICIGANVSGADISNSCYIGSIFAQPSSGGMAVFVNSDNKLGTVASSQRYKKDIKPMNKASEAILALNPVTFRYKSDVDPAGTSQVGLVAEEVEKVNPDLVVRDKKGKPYSVRYDQVNAMLLNEFLKEHKVVQQQGGTIAELTKEIAQLTAIVKEQGSQIQKVRAEIEVSKPTQPVAANRPYAFLTSLHESCALRRIENKFVARHP
jgi:trimeric autotransporter adhesin